MDPIQIVPKPTTEYYDEDYDGICLKYIPILNSEILLHPFYKFPAVDYPEIPSTPTEISDEEFYRIICEKLKINTIQTFIDQLATDEINLKYYGFNSIHMETMCQTLMRSNRFKKLDFSCNFLTEESCISLAKLLANNSENLEYLNLTNCRILPIGAKRLAEGLKLNTSIKELLLSFNYIEDEGIEALFSPEMNNSSIEKLDLKRNNLHIPMGLISHIFQKDISLKELDLSWNTIGEKKSIIPFLRNLKSNESVQVLNLSWNDLENFGAQINFFLRNNKTLRYLDISNNRLHDHDVTNISLAFAMLKSLEILKIGNNPISMATALKVIKNFQNNSNVLKTLDMENISVTPAFVNIVKNIMQRDDNIKVIHGNVIGNYEIIGPNIRELLFNRARYLSIKKKKKSKKDFAKFAITLNENFSSVPTNQEFTLYIRKKKILKDKNLVLELIDAFPSREMNHTNIFEMVNWAKKMWPDVVELLIEQEKAKAARAALKKLNRKKKKKKSKPKKLK